MGRPALLNRDHVVRAALELLDEEGSVSLSVERIARRLGVRGPSIYHHFTDKSEILGEVARLVLGDLDVRRIDDDWREWMLAICLTFYRRVLDHPACAVLLLEHLAEWATISGLGVGARVLSRADVDPAVQLLLLEGSEKLTWGWALRRALATAADDAGEDAHRAACARDEAMLEATLRSFLSGVVAQPPAGADRTRGNSAPWTSSA